MLAVCVLARCRLIAYLYMGNALHYTVASGARVCVNAAVPHHFIIVLIIAIIIIITWANSFEWSRIKKKMPKSTTQSRKSSFHLLSVARRASFFCFSVDSFSVFCVLMYISSHRCLVLSAQCSARLSHCRIMIMNWINQKMKWEKIE